MVVLSVGVGKGVELCMGVCVLGVDNGLCVR